MKIKIRNSKGITLIALILTIIILLILAGISFNAIAGENGILGNAMKSKLATEDSAAVEMIEMAWSARMTKFLEEKGIVTDIHYLNQLKDELNENLGNSGRIKELTVTNGKYNILYEDSSKNNYVVEVESNGKATVTESHIEETALARTKGYWYGKRVLTGVTSVNIDGTDVALDDNWKIFYIDGDEVSESNRRVYLIYGDYYSKKALPNVDGTIIKRSASGKFGIYASGNRDNLINYLNTSNNFTTIANTLKGTGKTFYGKTSLIVTGSPTLEMWMNSWNEKYGDNLGYYNITSTDVTNGRQFNRYNSTSKITASIQGMIMTRNMLSNVNDTEFEYYLPSTYIKEKAGYQEGYNPSNSNDTTYTDNLYYPRKGHTNDTDEEACYEVGYWLASPSPNASYDVCYVYYGGYVIYSSFDRTTISARPVVSILKSEFQEATGINLDG